jgi:WD40 repeat protein
MNASGSAFVAADSDGRLYRFDDTGETRFSLPLLNRAPDDALFVFQDAALQNGLGLVTYSINDEQHFRYLTLEFYSSQKQHFILDSIEYPPLQVWLDCSNQAAEDNFAGCVGWYSTQTAAGDQYVIQLPPMQTLPDDAPPTRISTDDLTILPYAPADDPEAVVRVGRIPMPYAVTSSETGQVKLWNLQTGEVLHSVNNGTGLPSVFGAINNPATHLVWRDNANETLYLLNFETGENRLIAPLNGAYAQWLFLSDDASVILAVNLDFMPVVVAWDTSTGARSLSGEHRTCGRPQPDTARFSADGSTLVIGCDTGLDIWRVLSGAESN